MIIVEDYKVVIEFGAQSPVVLKINNMHYELNYQRPPASIATNAALQRKAEPSKRQKTERS